MKSRFFEENLNLRNEDGQYNLLAELLSDRNNIPFIFVKFQGKNKASISERSDYGYGCLLTTYQKIKNRLQAENICISNTKVRPRKDTYLFDYDCVNEAVLNALVHNDWTITEPQISMYNDRLEILSHGGLPFGMTEKEFFNGVSKPRNKTLMRIFLSMGFTEHTGHGIPTIINKYGTSVFDINSNYILCTIPFDKEVVCKLGDNNVTKTVSVRYNINKNKGAGVVSANIAKYNVGKDAVRDKHFCADVGFSVGKNAVKKDIFDKNVGKSTIIDSNIEVNVGDDVVVEDDVAKDFVGKDVGLSNTEQRVLNILVTDSCVTSVKLAEELGVSKRTIERSFKTLQEKKIITREGSKRNGRWIVL